MRLLQGRNRRRTAPRREPAVIRGFDARVLFEGRAIFFGRRDRLQTGQRLDVNAQQFARKLKLAQLPRIARGAVDFTPRLSPPAASR